MSPTKKRSLVYDALGWLVSLFIPVALVLSAVRLMLTPAFLVFEYNTPNFPAEPYGFTQEDRLYWSRIAVDYLLNTAGIEYLGDLRFDDGTPVYNERELKHMLDVKIVVQKALVVWYVSLAGLALLGIWAWLGGWRKIYWRGLRRGGWLTVALLCSLLLVILLAFKVVFVIFHQIFFEAGTWTFLYTDTLIRLFPERFWRDIFIYVSSLSLLGSLLLAFGIPRKMRS